MTLELSGAAELRIHLDQLGDRMIPAAAAAMGETVESLEGFVVAKLSGDVLDVRTGQLRDSIHSRVAAEAGEIVGTVGVDPASPAAAYAGVHEFGGVFAIPEHLSHSRLGNEFTVRAHDANFPERSFLRSALSENAGLLGETFATAFARELAA